MEIKHFTINEVERFSGVKAHTIRIWELRYGIVEPVRDVNGYRLYSLEQLEKILHIALLNKAGIKISQLSNISPVSFERKLVKLSRDEDLWQKAIIDLIVNMYARDPLSFEETLDELLLTWPIDTLIEQIVYPFLLQMRLLWTGNKLMEEHMVVTAVRKKLIVAISSVHTGRKYNKLVVLFLPDGKQLDLGLLYTNYLLVKHGIPSIYMGIDVTIANLRIIMHARPPAFIFTYLLPNHHVMIPDLVHCMEQNAPASKLLIADYADAELKVKSKNIISLPFKEALEFLEREGKM